MECIPKIIHYCWFGRKPLPELAVKCLNSWKKYCPDYEIKQWNEDNFDIQACSYIKEAYIAQKWAFVTDYVRLKVLVDEGGIYMDTDVELVRPIDTFLHEHAFSGFEDDKNVPTGIMGCEKNFPLFNKMLDDYKDRHFINARGGFDETTNVVRITNICLRLGLKQNNKKQTICGFTLFPKDYFCPKSPVTGQIECTENTYAIHHFSGSWLSPKVGEIRKKEEKVIERFGWKISHYIISSFIWRIYRNIYSNGFRYTVKKIADKIKKG